MNFPTRPRRRDDEPTYEVTYNATMERERARAVTTTPAPLPADLAPERFSRYDVLAALRLGDAGGLTMREIADAIHAPLTRVNSLIYGLVQAGLVVAVDTATRKRYGGQLRRYRVVAPPVLDVGRAGGAHLRADVTPPPTTSTKGASEQAGDRRRAHPKLHEPRDRTE